MAQVSDLRLGEFLDTREKIIDIPNVLAISENWHKTGVRWKLVTGYFDVLTPDHVRSLQASAKGGPLIAAVLDQPDSLLPQRARAELAAALRVIDYVLLLQDTEHLEGVIQKLQPPELIRAEKSDQRRSQALIEHVHQRQKA